MIPGSSVDMCVKGALRLKGYFQPLSSNLCTVNSNGKPGPSHAYFNTKHTARNRVCFSVHATSSATRSERLHEGGIRKYFSTAIASVKGPRKKRSEISLACQNMHTTRLVPKQMTLPKVKNSIGKMTWLGGYASTGLIFVLVCFSSEPGHAEAASQPTEYVRDHSEPYDKFSNGKKVYTNYSVIGIPGDGRCLFRSVAHGACLRSGKPAPSEGLQRQLADDLRARVADEFVQRRKETEWFVEGDFDSYVSQIRKPHVWGGEPELFMASHVLQMPITVYMHDEDAGGLICIAEYGEEYGKENPIRVLYHGFGHYDALLIPGKRKSVNSRL